MGKEIRSYQGKKRNKNNNLNRSGEIKKNDCCNNDPSLIEEENTIYEIDMDCYEKLRRKRR